VHWQALLNKAMKIWDIQGDREFLDYLITYHEGPTILLMNFMMCTHQNIKALFVTSKGSGLEIKTQNTEFMFIFHEQNVGQNHTIKH
jgi:hypothetical protein